jgi:phage-related protein
MVDIEAQRTSLMFFRTGGGREPVREWLQAMDVVDRGMVGRDLMRAQWRWPIGMPLCRAMGQGLWEIRTDLSNHRIARVMLCMHEGMLVALHAFVKKTQKTPADELALARKRLKELRS